MTRPLPRPKEPTPPKAGKNFQKQTSPAPPLPSPSHSQPAANLCPTCRRRTLQRAPDPRLPQSCPQPSPNPDSATLDEPALGHSRPRPRPGTQRPPRPPPPATRVQPHLTYPPSGAGLHLSLRHVGPRLEPLRLPARWRWNLSGPRPPPTLQPRPPQGSFLGSGRTWCLKVGRWRVLRAGWDILRSHGRARGR